MDEQLTALGIKEIASHGVECGRGNIVGIQAFMNSADYRTKMTFHNKLDGYLRAAQEQGWINEKTVVVFPEYIGTWLVAAGEQDGLYQADSVEQAMQLMVRGNLLRFVGSIIFAKGSDRVKDALFRMKAEKMAAWYEQTFSALAHKYGATIVAGSIVLPQPSLEAGKLVCGKGPLQNVTAVYKPDGTAHAELVVKVYPIVDELSFTSGGSNEALPVFETPAGRLAVLICADSWYPAPYEALKHQFPDLVVVPNNLMPAGCWDQPWQGYNPGPMPADVDPADVGRLKEGEAWLKYALGGRLAACGASAGMHVFFRGNVWDLSSEGRMISISGGTVKQSADVDGAALVNLWLPAA